MNIVRVRNINVTQISLPDVHTEVCLKYKIKKPGKGSVYKPGIRYCKGCEVFMKWDKVRCPCCSRVTRVRKKGKIE